MLQSHHWVDNMIQGVNGLVLAVSVLLWGFRCTERVDGLSALSLLRDRYCFDSRESGVIWPSAQAGLCCDVSLPRSRHYLDFRRKRVIWPSARTKPAVLNLPLPRYCPDSQRSGVFWPSVKAERSSHQCPDSPNSSKSPFFQVIPSSG